MKPPELKTWQAILLGFLGGAITIAAVFYISLPEKMVPLTTIATPIPKPLVIHVSGEVKNPGVYYLDPGSRVLDSLMAAGDFSDNADLDKINLAAPLVDGQKVFIPVKGDDLAANTAIKSTSEPKDLIVHLNTATQEELDMLPGIGVERASTIISERDKRGRFQSIDELRSIPGISTNLFQQIEPYILLD